MATKRRKRRSDQANAIAKGHATGYSVFWSGSTGTPRVTVWQLDETPEDLGVTGIGQAINSQGEVVGVVTDTAIPQAFLWTQGMVTQLGTLPGFDSSIATGINDSEQVVGVSYSQQNPEHQAGFIWTAQTGMQVIEGAASASGINSLVDIAATSLALRAAIFTATGATIDLGTLGDFSVATSVHSKRNAVGYSPTQSGGPVHAFFYNGTMQDLGTMQVGSNTNATSVNDSDLVVGGSNLAGNSLAFVWSATTGIQDLNGLDLSEFRLGTGNGGGGRPRKESS